MKVFGCKMQGSYCGGVVLVAANSKEEAFQTAANYSAISYHFCWEDKYGSWMEPFSEGATLKSRSFPLDCWEEYEHLSADYENPTLIVADYHAE